MPRTPAEKVKITNLIAIVTCVIALLYASYFCFALAEPNLALLNVGFVLCYGLTLLLSARGHYCLAKTWFLSILMLHIFILTVFIFSPAAGFHFYYLLLPPGVLLLFEDDDNLQKNGLMVAGVVLFFVCDLLGNEHPLVPLSPQAAKALFMSTIFVVMVEVYLIMLVFTRAIARNEAALQELATKDVLTGINNRRSFIDIGEELFEHAKRYQKPMALLLFDIDHFKKINDTYGHLAGDKALKLIAGTLKRSVRASDTLARYGGEEFVVLLPETSEYAAMELAEHLRAKISQISLDVGEKKLLSFTVSVGAAQYSSETDSLMAMVHQADIALYKAKNAGRDQAVAYDPSFAATI